MHIELSNQRVLVTAGAQGIGLAIAQAFVTAGSQVHICDVNAEFLATAKQLLPGVSQTLCDVSREDQVQAMFQELGQRWGGLDALINNAGIAGPTAKLEDTALAQWNETIAVNLTGQFLCARAALSRGRAAALSSTCHPLRVAWAFPCARPTRHPNLA